MFTSRAEYRLLLREESADLRLSRYGHELGLISDEDFAKVEKKRQEIAEAMKLINETSYTPNKEFIEFLHSIDEEKINDRQSAQQIISRKTFTLEKLPKLLPQLAKYSPYIQEEILVEAKYARYVQKQQEDIAKMKKLLHIKIPEGFDFSSVSGLSKEIVEKFETFNPPTLQAASQISGVTPAAIDILQIYIKMGAKKV
jgi:tRNA uridine 5-carboxymethylaminomethyl modification enzyme